MEIRREAVGVTRGHEAQGPTAVTAYTLDAGPRLSVTVWTYGATLVEVVVPDRAGRPANVVVRFPDLAAYEQREGNPYLGATLGRFARSVAGSRFRLDGVEHVLAPNFGRHHFHGGPVGFDRFVWDAEAERTADDVAVHLRHASPDGDQGYPGAVEVRTTYRARPDGRLTIAHTATTTASTIVALTNHAYWNLAGTGTIDDHRLRVNASRVVALDDDLVPAGPLEPVAGTALDYRSARRIGGAALDDCFVLDGGDPAAEVHHPATGRRLRLTTDQPGLAIHSADEFRRPRAGLTLQTGALPDAPNRPDFPPARLDPGTTHRHVAIHDFSVG